MHYIYTLDADAFFMRESVAALCAGADNKGSQGAGGSDSAPVVIGKLNDWLATRSKGKEGSGTSSKKRRKTMPEYTLPPHLAGVPDLPPSLKLPSKDDFVNLPLLEWG